MATTQTAAITDPTKPPPSPVPSVTTPGTAPTAPTPDVATPTTGRSAGLINQSINASDPLGHLAGYTPQNVTINPATDTVEGRVASITAKDSPLMQQARTNALATMNRRGLLNSSMANQAGEEAVLNAALPIATTDVNNAMQAKEFNANAGNTAGQFNAGAINTGSAQQEAGAQNIAGIQEQGAQSRENIAAQGAQNIQGIIEQGNQQLKQISAQGGQTRLTSAQSYQQSSDLMTQKANIDTALQTLQAKQASGLSAQEAQQMQDLQTQKGQIDQQLQTLHDNQMSTLQMNLQTLKGDQATQVAQIEAQYRNMIQADSSAAAFFGQISQDMTSVLTNADMTTEAKQQQVDKQIQLLQSGLAVIGGSANLDLNSLLTFS